MRKGADTMLRPQSTQTDYVKLEFPSLPKNVGFARSAAAIYASRLDFTLDEIDEIKVAASEAVSNAVIHGYRDTVGTITMEMIVANGDLWIHVTDSGRGIEDVEWARQATHTSLPDVHMGLGFVFMDEYMDELVIESYPGEGTLLKMKKGAGMPKSEE